MHVPPPPADETRRLVALAEYRILDTEPEAQFDDLTRLAAQLCGAPIALISLVEEARQWFKSRVGLAATETPRAVSFCSHAIQGPDLLIVPDATLDARFAGNPLVTGDPHVRFYAGAPLRTAEGHALGTLCVIDRVPRELLPEQRETLRILSRQVMAQLDLRRTLRDLAARERLLLAVTEDSTDAVFVKDREGRYLLFNAAASAFVGRSAAGILGRDDAEIFDAKSAALITARDRRVIATGRAETEEETITAAGLQRTFLAMKAPYRDHEGKIIGTIGVSRDITERKQAEAALGASEQLYRSLVTTMAEGVVFQEAGGRITACNPAAERILGLPADQITGRTSVDPRWSAIRENGFPFPGTEHPAMVALRTGAPQVGVMMGVHRPDGSLAWISINARPIFPEGASEPASVVCSFADVTARKNAEILAGQHRGVMEMIAMGAPMEKTLDTLLRTIEGQSDDMFCSVQLLEADGRHLRNVSGPRLPTAFREAIAGVAIGPAAGSCGTAVFRGEPVCVEDIATDPLWAGNQELPLAHGLLACWATPIFDCDHQALGTLAVYFRKPTRPSDEHRRLVDLATQTAAIAISRHRSDAALRKANSELRASQEKLVQQERLRAFGQMASGVAHDINNAICPVSIYTKVLLRTDGALSPQAREYLEIIQKAAKAVGDTVARLRRFNREENEAGAIQPVCVATLIGEATALTRARWGDMTQETGVVIDLRTDLAADLPAIDGLDSELTEALINLIFNAVDAMPEGGTLTVRAHAVHRTPGEPAGVCIEVADTGAGMDEETRRRCLDPFFTTKGSHGTGIGLAIVSGILQRHGAEIAIESAPGAGTTLRLLFPPPQVRAERAEKSPAASVVPSLKLLVADDDPRILHALRVAFESDGHQPHCVRGGHAALLAFQAALEAGEPFDAVFTDLGMPHVDGRKVAAFVKAGSPETPVILLTGWGQSMQADGEIPPGVDRLLAKPVAPQELHAALAACRPRARQSQNSPGLAPGGVWQGALAPVS